MFRPMRRHRQQLPEEECRAILRDEPRGVLALLGDNGYPYTVPMDFVLDGECIYFHSALEGHKLDAVKAYDKASFCVIDKGERPDDDWAYYFRSVIAFGRVSVLTDPDEKAEKLRLLGSKYFPTFDEVEREMNGSASRAAVIRLRIEHLSGKRVHER